MNAELTFLELSMPAPDVRESLAWYTGLGFAELTTNDARDYPYAVVSDGHLCIGLHGAHITTPGLSFVQPELAHRARRMEAEGCEFELLALGIDQFHETLQADPDGSLAVMTEARTFSSSHAADAAPVTGEIERIALPCARLPDSVEFWQRYGFIGVVEEDQLQAELHAPGLRLQFEQGTRAVALHCHPVEESVIEQLYAHYDVRSRGDTHELVSPEGTRMRLAVGTGHG